MNKIADYDTYDYDYSTYWNKREYEHKAELLVLNRLLSKSKGKWFLDIGGSFGRVSPVYSSKYSNPVIVDYSLKTLQKNYSTLKKKYPNIELIAANAYYLPFKGYSFDAAMMIRVLHHIEEPKQCIKEIYRVLNSEGIYIQEFANKLHIKAVIRAILTLNFSVFSKEPYQQPNKQNYEGAKKGSNVLFLNYQLAYIKGIFKSIGFKVSSVHGCSFLRLNIFKKMFKINFLILLENIFQRTLSWANISPSIFVKAIKSEKNKSKGENNNLEDILVCPKCKDPLAFKDNTASCSKCKNRYKKKENIWDFRI